MPKPEWLGTVPISATNPKADTKLLTFLIRLIRGEDLSFNEAAEFFDELTDSNSNSIQIAAALTALTAKGETGDEIAGMQHSMSAQSVKITSRYSNIINISGLGSNTIKTFNVSTATAFVVAGAGLRVAKHTARGTLNQLGSAEVFEKLNVKVAVEPNIAEACLNGAGICHLFSPIFHPRSIRLKEISRSLGILTCLNMVESLSNAANAPYHLIGVWHPALIKRVAAAFQVLNTKRAWVVHGTDGLDELTISGKSIVTEVSEGKIRTFSVEPEEFGLKPGSIEHLKVDTADESAVIIREVLETKRRDEARTLIVLNAAAALIIGGVEKSPKLAARLAEQSIDSRSALTKLDRLVGATNRI